MLKPVSITQETAGPVQSNVSAPLLIGASPLTSERQELPKDGLPFSEVLASQVSTDAVSAESGDLSTLGHTTSAILTESLNSDALSTSDFVLGQLTVLSEDSIEKQPGLVEDSAPTGLLSGEAVVASLLEGGDVDVSLLNAVPVDGAMPMMPETAPLSDIDNIDLLDEDSLSTGFSVLSSDVDAVKASTLGLTGGEGALKQRNVLGAVVTLSEKEANDAKNTKNLNLTQPGQATTASSQLNTVQSNTTQTTMSGAMTEVTKDIGSETSRVPGFRPVQEGVAKTEKSDSFVAWGSMAQASSATSSGQQGFSQSQGGQSQSHAQQQASFSQLQQNTLDTTQAAKMRFSDALSSASSLSSVTDTDKTASLLGSLGLSSDAKGQLPLGLQAINTPVRHPQWGQALGQRVVVMADTKVQEAKIMLNPEKLGPIQIKLSVDKDQVVHVSMLAQQGVTREAMENSLPKLKEMLEMAGIEYGSLDVGSEEQFEEQAQQNGDHLAHGHKQNNQSEEEVAENTAILQPKTDNIVDYYA